MHRLVRKPTQRHSGFFFIHFAHVIYVNAPATDVDK